MAFSYKIDSASSFRPPGHRSLAVVTRRILACAASFLPLLIHLPALAQSPPDESHVKAAFVFHFAQLVDWPPEVLGPPNRPMNFCVVGEDSMDGVLESTVRGKLIGNHPIFIRHLQEKDDGSGCHLLFLAVKDKKRAAAILAGLKAAPILTVGESEDFAPNGGMIGLSLQENKIRFDINLRVAQHANLKISSRLLLLAKNVISDGRQG